MNNRLVRATVDASLPEEILDVNTGYVRLKAIADALADVDPSLGAWYSLPETRRGLAVSLSRACYELCPCRDNVYG